MTTSRSIALGLVATGLCCTRVVVVREPVVVVPEVDVVVEPAAEVAGMAPDAAPPDAVPIEVAMARMDLMREPDEIYPMPLECDDRGSCFGHQRITLTRCGVIGRIARFTPTVRGQIPAHTHVSIQWKPAAQLAVWDERVLAVATTGAGHYMYQRSGVPATIDVQVKTAHGGECTGHDIDLDVSAHADHETIVAAPIEADGALADQHVPVLWRCWDRDRGCNANLSTLVVTCPRQPSPRVTLAPPAPPSRATADRFVVSFTFPAADAGVYADGADVATSRRAGSLSLDLAAPYASIMIGVGGTQDRCTTHSLGIGLAEWYL